MHFHGTVVLGGKTATGIQVPADVVRQLDSGKRPRVTVAVGGHTYRTTVAAYAEGFWIPLSAENRGAAGLAAGDEVDVEITLDTAPRVVELPDDLAHALHENPASKARFDQLSYSRQRAIVLGVDGAKTQQTRHRRIDKAIDDLGRED